MRGSWRLNITATFWPPLLWPSALCLSRSPWMLNRRPGGSAFCWVLAFSTTSCQQPQLFWLPTQSDALWAPLAWCGFPYHISSLIPTPTPWLLSWLSYIIVQRPLNRPLNLWNGMFVRHQAEITVMQFTGHSLPVHHSEVGPSPCPILSAELTCAISSHNCHWNVSLPSGPSLWMAFLAGSKFKYNKYLDSYFFQGY